VRDEGDASHVAADFKMTRKGVATEGAVYSFRPHLAKVIIEPRGSTPVGKRVGEQEANNHLPGTRSKSQGATRSLRVLHILSRLEHTIT
jgi:hypothetical protein